MPHDHGHAHIEPDSGDRRVAIAIWANGLLTVAKIVGGCDFPRRTDPGGVPPATVPI